MSTSKSIIWFLVVFTNGDSNENRICTPLIDLDCNISETKTIHFEKNYIRRLKVNTDPFPAHHSQYFDFRLYLQVAIITKRVFAPL